jgi:glutamyl/glutaminyl-tRNA synthetase
MKINIIIQVESAKQLKEVIRDLIQVEKDYPCTVSNAEVKLGYKFTLLQ